jgi:hypothetical protein
MAGFFSCGTPRAFKAHKFPDEIVKGHAVPHPKTLQALEDLILARRWVAIASRLWHYGNAMTVGKGKTSA